LIELALFVESEGKMIASLAVSGIEFNGLVPFRGGRGVIAFASQFASNIGEAVKLRCGRVHLGHAVGRNVDELGDVHAAIGGGGVLDENGGGILAVFVNVGEEKLGVERAAFGGEGKPSA